MRQHIGFAALIVLAFTCWRCGSSTSVAVEPIVLGFIPPSVQSAQVSTHSLVATNGVSTAVHLINANGGIGGRQVALVTADANYSLEDPNQVLQLAQNIVDQNNAVAFVVSGSLDFYRNWAHDNGVVVFSGAGDQSGLVPNDYAYATVPVASQFAFATAFDMNSLGYSNIAELSAGQGYDVNLQFALFGFNPQSQLNVVGYPTLSDYSNWDPNVFVTQALTDPETNLPYTPDAILLSTLSSVDAGQIIQSLISKNYAGKIYLSPSAPALPANIGPTEGAGLRFVTFGHAPGVSTPQQQQFETAYANWSGQSFQNDSSGFTEQFFDTALWTLLAVARAGTLGDGGGPAVTAAIGQVVDPTAAPVDTTDIATAYKYFQQNENIRWLGVVNQYQINYANQSIGPMIASECCDANGLFSEVVAYPPAQYDPYSTN